MKLQAAEQPRLIARYGVVLPVTIDITIVTMAATARMIEIMILIVFDICLVLLGFDTPILGRSRPALKDTKRAKALFH